MKRTLITLALAGSFALGMTALPAFAQDSTPPPQPPPPMQQGPGGMHHGWHHHRMSPERQLEHMTRALNLTEAQQEQLKPILKEQDQKMRAIWQSQAQQRRQMREQMMAAAKESKAKIEAVLTPEQKQKFDAMIHRRMEHMHHWRHQGGPPPPQPPPPPSQPQQQ